MIGTRHGEKLYETLPAARRWRAPRTCGDFFRVAGDARDLDYGALLRRGRRAQARASSDYNSHNDRAPRRPAVVERCCARCPRSVPSWPRRTARGRGEARDHRSGRLPRLARPVRAARPAARPGATGRPCDGLGRPGPPGRWPTAASTRAAPRRRQPRRPRRGPRRQHRLAARARRGARRADARPAGRLRQLDPGRQRRPRTATARQAAAEHAGRGGGAAGVAEWPTSGCRTCSASTAGRTTTRWSPRSATALAAGEHPEVDDDRELTLLHAQDAADELLARDAEPAPSWSTPRATLTTVSALLDAARRLPRPCTPPARSRTSPTRST